LRRSHQVSPGTEKITDVIPFADNLVLPADSPLIGHQSADASQCVAAARSNHTGGIVIVGMVDGSVHAISGDTIDLTVWRAMATRAGGENVALPW